MSHSFSIHIHTRVFFICFGTQSSERVCPFLERSRSGDWARLVTPVLLLSLDELIPNRIVTVSFKQTLVDTHPSISGKAQAFLHFSMDSVLAIFHTLSRYLGEELQQHGSCLLTLAGPSWRRSTMVLVVLGHKAGMDGKNSVFSF